MLSRSQQLLYQIIKDKKIVDDKTKLAKFQYLVDFIHFAFHNHTVSDSTIIYTKQKQGPLSRSLTDDLKFLIESGYIQEDAKFKYKIVKNLVTSFTREEHKTISYVLDKYGELTWKELVDLSHSQTPYLSADNGGIIELFTSYNLVDQYSDYAQKSTLPHSSKLSATASPMPLQACN